MTKEEIGQILRGLRTSAGMTQKDVAEAIGRKQQVVGHWETGYSQPDANTLFVLCDLYGADINEAFGFTTKKVDLNKHEQAVIVAYRKNPDMQAAVDRLLHIEAAEEEEETVRIFRAARSEYNAEAQVMDVSRERLDKLKNASEVTDI